MANEYSVNKADLISLADAMRAKAGTTDPLVFPNDFVEMIGNFGDLSYLVNETITLASNIVRTSQVIFTSDKLKNLTDYHEIVFERTTVSTLGITAILHRKNINGEFSMSVRSGKWDVPNNNGNPSVTIDENGNVTVSAGTSYYINEGEYRLYVIGK